MHTHRALVCVVQGNLPASRECMPVVHSVSTGVFWGTGPLGRKKGTPLQSWLLPTSWASEEPVFPFSVHCAYVQWTAELLPRTGALIIY